MARTLIALVTTLLASLALAGQAQAVGGNYVIVGGSDAAQQQVRAALDASRFNWSLVPAQITIRITSCGCAGASPGEIILHEGDLVGSPYGPQYGWGIVQHEYAHQVDFFLLKGAQRGRLLRALGGQAWCYEVEGLEHDEYGCERFAAALAWAYWRSPANIQRPDWQGGASLRPTQFRQLLARTLAAARAARRA